MDAARNANKAFRVAIVGGGIGGLALAIGLQQNGIAFDLYEAASEFGEIGAGVSMAENSQKALGMLGLREEYDEMATFNPEGLFFEFRNGEMSGDNLIITKKSTHLKGISSIHRARLIDILTKHLPTHVCHLGKRVEYVKVSGQEEVVMKTTDVSGCEQTERSGKSNVRLHFSDATVSEADIVVACDGIHSQIRPTVSNEHNLRWTGTWAYRGLIGKADFITALGEERGAHLLCTPQMVCGKDRHVLFFHIDHGETINVVAFTTDRSRYPDWPELDSASVQDSSLDELLPAFEGFDEETCRILRLIKSPKKWALHHLFPSMETYVRGPVCLLGDAAHGGTPHQGALAGQALEDAAVLSWILAHPSVSINNLTSALKIYDDIRRPRANKVLETSLSGGEMLEFAGSWQQGQAAVERDVKEGFDWIWEHNLQDDLVLADQKLREINISALTTPTS